MATLGKEYQPRVKDAANVLVGVAQVRVGRPSVRAAGTAAVKAVQFVGTSAITVDTSTGTSVDIVRPSDMSTGGTLPTGCTLAASGTYTGDYDGCFIIRVTDSTTVDIYGPNAYKDADVAISSLTNYNMKLAAATTSGALISGTPATSPTAGQTFVVPVWSGTAQDKNQTGIVSPYSMFSGSTESVGGLKSASFSPKLESVKTLEAGFPSEVFDRIVERTSVEVAFESFEYTNDNIQYLKNMVSEIINEAKLPSVPVEIVMRTRGNSLISFWINNCSITQFPSYSPISDYSALTWSLGTTKLTEITGATSEYNVWLSNAPIYTELLYTH